MLREPGRDGAGLLAAGCLERSNVDTVREQISLLVLQRWFAGVSGAMEKVLEMKPRELEQKVPK